MIAITNGFNDTGGDKGVGDRSIYSSATSFISITMRLYTLLGMEEGDMTFVLHMHYDFGLWHKSLGLGLWVSL
jgi:hypothetical protein